MYPTTIPWVIQKMFAPVLWQVKDADKKIFLTFDDGPTPVVTEWVLDLLKSNNARATFFCIGANVLKHPAIFERTKAEGHAIGNHSFTHPDGWKTEISVYLEDVAKAAEVIDSKLFRPPYAHLKWAQYQALKKQYKIVAWNVLPWDFEAKLTKEDCLNKVMKHTKSGSVIVFHDYERTFEKLQYCLPKILEHFTSEGYTFEAISV